MNLWLQINVFLVSINMYGQSYILKKNNHRRIVDFKSGKNTLIGILFYPISVFNSFLISLGGVAFLKIDFNFLQKRNFPDKAIALILRNNGPGS